MFGTLWTTELVLVVFDRTLAHVFHGFNRCENDTTFTDSVECCLSTLYRRIGSLLIRTTVSYRGAQLRTSTTGRKCSKCPDDVL